MEKMTMTHLERADLLVRVFAALVQGPAVAAYLRPGGLQGGVTFNPMEAAAHADQVLDRLILSAAMREEASRGN